MNCLPGINQVCQFCERLVIRYEQKCLNPFPIIKPIQYCVNCWLKKCGCVKK